MTLRIFQPSCDDNALLASALAEFQCEAVPQHGGRSESGRRYRRRQCVTETTGRFTAAMSSANPPRSEEEAVARLAPVAAWFFSWLIQQLAIQVIKFLWRKWHEPSAATLNPKVGA